MCAMRVQNNLTSHYCDMSIKRSEHSCNVSFEELEHNFFTRCSYLGPSFYFNERPEQCPLRGQSTTVIMSVMRLEHNCDVSIEISDHNCDWSIAWSKQIIGVIFPMRGQITSAI